jgi:hypothetical protein
MAVEQHRDPRLVGHRRVGEHEVDGELGEPDVRPDRKSRRAKAIGQLIAVPVSDPSALRVAGQHLRSVRRHLQV